MTHVNVDVTMSNQEVLQQQLNITNVAVGVPAETFVEASQAAFEARFIAGAVINEAQIFAVAAAAEYSQVVASASDAMVRQHDAAALESARRDDEARQLHIMLNRSQNESALLRAELDSMRSIAFRSNSNIPAPFIPSPSPASFAPAAPQGPCGNNVAEFYNIYIESYQINSIFIYYKIII